MMLNSIPPKAIAPMYEAAPRWPVMATSTSPSSGTVMLLTMLGTAMSRICLSVFFMSLPKIPECFRAPGDYHLS